MASCVAAVRRRNHSWAQIAKANPKASESAEPVFAAARRIAKDVGTSVPKRVRAFRLLGHQPSHRDADTEFLFSLVSPRVTPEIQIAAVQMLADNNAPGLAERLLEGWKSHGPRLRPVVSSTFLSRREWLIPFVGALQSGQIEANDVDLAARSRLLHSRDFSIRNRSHRIFEETNNVDRETVVRSYQRAIPADGEITRGRIVFDRACSSCHRHANIGTDLGPKLSALQDKSDEFLLTAILDPNRAIGDQYQSYVVVTEAGRTFGGLIKEETAGSIQLANQDGKIRTILRTDIDEVVNTGKSFMPEGLE